MKPFAYVRAESESAALASGRLAGASYIAGGTGVVDLLRLGVETPDTLVDLSTLPWRSIEQTADGVRVGALVNNTQLAYDERIRRDFPVLSEAILAGASPQLRNMASTAGNLLQRTRCPYFRDPAIVECNKRREGSGCAALEGYTRQHAVLGGSPLCIAVHPSDMCVALVALDAVVETTERRIPIAEFHTLPGEHPARESVLSRGELVRSLFLPRQALAKRSVYVKARDRASYAFALASAAVALELDGTTIRDVRVALGGVATKPWRSVEAEAVLKGSALSKASAERAATAALAAAAPRADNGFKVELAKRVLMRALARAGEGA